MDSEHDKTRMNVESDRFSGFPIELIHKILSFLDTREIIGTSALSSRWRFIWQSMPYLDLSTEDFSILPKFYKFATNVFSRRDNLTDVYSLKLRFRVKASHMFVKRILDYAFSHNIQHLDLVCVIENDSGFPLTLLASQSLKHLSLTTQRSRRRTHPIDSWFLWTWNLPALTTLDLHSVTFGDRVRFDVFSQCKNLENLTLKKFKKIGSTDLNIFHDRLSNLTIENCGTYGEMVNVAAPQLKNLTIRSCYTEKFKISAPDLASLLYKGYHPLHLFTEGFPSLEKADVSVFNPQKANAREIVSLLQHLHHVNSLTINLEIVELLSSSEELLLNEPSPFVNLNSLKIYPEIVYGLEQAPKKITMSDVIKSYLLDGSSGCAFKMVLREEIKAQDIMAELGVFFEKEKENTKTNNSQVEQGRAQVESHNPKSEMGLEIGGKMAQIQSRWKNLGEQIEKANVIISKVKEIEELLTSLPASKRANLLPIFSSMCSKADTVIDQVNDCRKIRPDESQSLSSVCFPEHATELESSS